MFEIPTFVEIGGKKLTISDRGDYRMILYCFAALNDVTLDKAERIYAALIIFYNEFDNLIDIANFPYIKEAIEKMFWFINCGDDKGIGAVKHYKLIDWEQDSQLIASAINKVANTEIRAVKYLHWWTFMGYYLAIGESPLATIVGIRNKIMEGKKLEKYEVKFKHDNPQYFVWDNKSLEDKEAEEAVMALWNNGG